MCMSFDSLVRKGRRTAQIDNEKLSLRCSYSTVIFDEAYRNSFGEVFCIELLQWWIIDAEKSNGFLMYFYSLYYMLIFKFERDLISLCSTQNAAINLSFIRYYQAT